MTIILALVAAVSTALLVIRKIGGFRYLNADMAEDYKSEKTKIELEISS